jgi:hypothetical protein
VTTLETGPRCSAWIREQEVDPIGSAGSFSGYLLLEWPLPWPRDLSEISDLAPVHAALAGSGLRLQGLVPLFGDEEARRVIRYTPTAGPGFGGYERAERIVTLERVVDTAVELALGAPGEPDWARAAVTHDVLVCTHGSRDTCCGAQGTALVMELSADPARFGGAIRLWRTSHTGGHRFAPTAIFLPQGTMWASMDTDAMRRIVAREGPLDDLLPRYRGCPGMASPAIQAIEREAFAEVGWDWLRWHRVGEHLDDGRVRVTGTSPTGEEAWWEGAVELRRDVPVPDCGRPIAEAKKSEAELAVVDLVAAAPRSP